MRTVAAVLRTVCFVVDMVVMPSIVKSGGSGGENMSKSYPGSTAAYKTGSGRNALRRSTTLLPRPFSCSLHLSARDSQLITQHTHKLLRLVIFPTSSSTFSISFFWDIHPFPAKENHLCAFLFYEMGKIHMEIVKILEIH